MALTTDELIALTGGYWISTGELIAFVDGKHISYAHRDTETGEITLTDEGRALAGTDEPIDVAAIVAEVAAEEAPEPVAEPAAEPVVEPVVEPAAEVTAAETVKNLLG